MTNCTNCVKYKLLLTWSTFHFRGAKRPSIFICAKNKNMIKDLTPDIDSTNKTLHSLCLIEEGHTPSVVSNMTKPPYRTVTSCEPERSLLKQNKPPKVRTLPATPNFLLILFLLQCSF